MLLLDFIFSVKLRALQYIILICLFSEANQVQNFLVWVYIHTHTSIYTLYLYAHINIYNTTGARKKPYIITERKIFTLERKIKSFPRVNIRNYFNVIKIQEFLIWFDKLATQK